MGSHNENRRALVVAASYSPGEWGRLGAALLPDRFVRRAGFAAYVESWRFLREAPRHHIHAERRGQLTLLEDTGAEIGSHQIAVRRGASDVAVSRQCLIQRLYEPLVRLARHAFLVVRVGELTPTARRECVPGGAAGLAALAIPQEYARAWG